VLCEHSLRERNAQLHHLTLLLADKEQATVALVEENRHLLLRADQLKRDCQQVPLMRNFIHSAQLLEQNRGEREQAQSDMEALRQVVAAEQANARVLVEELAAYRNAKEEQHQASQWIRAHLKERSLLRMSFSFVSAL